MKVLKSIITTILSIFILNTAVAGEGMWLPIFLKALNEAEMKSMGMKISAEDIYSVNEGSLKDAIVHFGGFCTGEVISNNGLLLTNHHCGYGQIQSHSSIEDNILQDGFWAKTYADEKPNPGLFVTFVDRIDDVTAAALVGLTDDMTMAERQSVISKNLDALKANYDLKPFENVIIRPFYNGLQYFAFKTVQYNDIRLVGTPPEMIGKFGADTDNWVFPRHTGDFAVFRIYAGPNNEPADYSPENKPFTPKHFLPISLDGVEEDDFTMVFGFPGRTSQYLPSYALRQTADVLNPAKIEIRDNSLKIIDKYMRADPAIKIKYASKFASVANYWKKWIGESQGLKTTYAIDKKKRYEAEFRQRSEGKYKDLLPQFKTLYKDIEPYAKARDVYSEVAQRGIESIRLMGVIRRLVNTYENNGEQAYNGFKARVIPYLENYYKNYEADIDQEVMGKLLELASGMMDSKYLPEELTKSYLFSKGTDHKGLAKSFMEQTPFSSLEKATALLDKSPKEAVEIMKNDPLYDFSARWQDKYVKENAPISSYQSQIDSLQRIYMAAQMEVLDDKTFWPDANSTMRITYGKVDGYNTHEGKPINYTTYVDGIMEKYVPGNYEFDVPSKLRKLIQDKDYGNYADKTGSVPVCFIGTNHTTGGNSGSPAIDAYGNLVGLNFDRTWESTMSDLNYDPRICRNIMVDARYILWVIDKYAGAQRLIDEMKLVRPKG